MRLWNSGSAPGTIERPDLAPSERSGGCWVVTVYNNDYNTYDQVILILVAATGCTDEEAFIEAWEIDHIGKSVVHHGGEAECQRVAAIIATIGIHVEVSEE